MNYDASHGFGLAYTFYKQIVDSYYKVFVPVDPSDQEEFLSTQIRPVHAWVDVFHAAESSTGSLMIEYMMMQYTSRKESSLTVGGIGCIVRTYKASAAVLKVHTAVNSKGVALFNVIPKPGVESSADGKRMLKALSNYHWLADTEIQSGLYGNANRALVKRYKVAMHKAVEDLGKWSGGNPEKFVNVTHITDSKRTVAEGSFATTYASIDGRFRRLLVCKPGSPIDDRPHPISINIPSDAYEAACSDPATLHRLKNIALKLARLY